MNIILGNMEVGMKKAFTLAEVLITLGVIGIVAALTIPGVIEGYKKKETVAKLQKAYTILNQAFKRSQIDNGEYQYWSKGVDIGLDAYYKLYWYPYFQITTICDTYQECGYKSNTPWLGSDNQKQPALFSHKDFRVPFLTSDGILYSISIASGEADNSLEAFWIDINGPKNPNQYGIDVFLFVPTENNVIMPYGYDFSSALDASHCGGRKRVGGAISACDCATWQHLYLSYHLLSYAVIYLFNSLFHCRQSFKQCEIRQVRKFPSRHFQVVDRSTFHSLFRVYYHSRHLCERGGWAFHSDGKIHD